MAFFFKYYPSNDDLTKFLEQKVKKLVLNSQLLSVQILTNDVQVLIFCLSYFITTVLYNIIFKLFSKHSLAPLRCMHASQVSSKCVRMVLKMTLAKSIFNTTCSMLK